MKTSSQRDPRDRALWILALVAILAIAVALWALFGRGTAPSLPPDRAPAADPAAVPYDDGTLPEEREGGGSVNLRYRPEAVIDLSTGKAALFFANPPSSDQGLVLQLTVRGTVLAESGLLAPGTALEEMALLPGMAERLQPGGYDASFLVTCYDAESGEQAILQTEARITLTVTAGDGGEN